MNSTLKMKKTFLFFTLISLLSVGCGKDNTSGGNSNNSAITTVPGTFNSGVPTTQSSNFLVQQIAQVKRCNMGEQRVSATIPVNGINANVGASYVGLSSYGDIALIQNLNGQVVMNVFICQRQGASITPQLSDRPIVNNSLEMGSCSVGEITKAWVSIPSQIGASIPIGFSPIRFHNVNVNLCAIR